MTEYRVPEVLREDRDSDEFEMPVALEEYHQ